MMIGYICMLNINFQIAFRNQSNVITYNFINEQIWLWILMLPLLVFPTMSIQDFRDIEGDSKINRKTMPLVWGNKYSRIFISAICCIFYPIGCYFCLFQYGVNYYRVISYIILVVYIWFVSFRLLRYQHCRKQDNITYQMWAAFFFLFELSALVAF